MDPKVAYWVDLATYDIDTADAMLESKRYLYVGFMAHQSIEKILKAHYVMTNGGVPPHSHSLALLAKKSEICMDLSEDQFTLLDILEPLNIEARYPAHKEQLLKSLSHDRCVSLLTQTKELYVWILKRLSI